jgi:hypothetical protein
MAHRDRCVTTVETLEVIMLSSLRRKHPYDRREGSLVLPNDVLPVLDAGGVPTLPEALPRLSAELHRARRYGRPLAVAVLSLDPVACDMVPTPSAVGDFLRTKQAGLFPLLSALLAPSLREALRLTDMVSYTTKEAQSLVMLPETTAEGARLAVARLLQVSAIQVLSPLRIGLAAFPDDGWTLEDVIVRAETSWAHREFLSVHGLNGDH